MKRVELKSGFFNISVQTKTPNYQHNICMFMQVEFNRGKIIEWQ